MGHVVKGGENIADTYLDVFDINMGLNKGTNTVVIAGGFASETLKIFQGSNWINGTISTQVIDTDGNCFYQQFSDLDRDGTEDVIASIGSYGKKNGMLVVYKGNVDSKDFTYSLSEKEVVYDEFPVWDSSALGSPGEAREFFYGVKDRKRGKLPNILVSGDDDGNFYMFSPYIDDNENFTFG